jgi:hypothetical protein
MRLRMSVSVSVRLNELRACRVAGSGRGAETDSSDRAGRRTEFRFGGLHSEEVLDLAADGCWVHEVSNANIDRRLHVQLCSRSARFRDIQPSASAQEFVSYVPHLSVVKAIYSERLPVCWCVTRRVS